MPNALQDMKVLIVDDSKTIRRTAEVLLEGEGCAVAGAEDGFIALGKVVEQKPDVILLDIMMPRLDGYQTCSLLKAHADYRDVPIILLTSRDSLADKARAEVVGADGFITKPFTRDEIREALSATRG